jgi:hypothetical protein
MKRSELKALIKEMVTEILEDELQEQVKSYTKSVVRVYTPMVVKETCEDMVKDAMMEMINPKAAGKASINESMSLAHLLNESDDEIRTLSPGDIYEHAAKTQAPNSMDRQKIAAMMGYGGMPGATGSNTIDVVHDEHGNEIPIPRNAIPASVDKALNRDYRDFLKKVDRNVQSRRPG